MNRVSNEIVESEGHASFDRCRQANEQHQTRGQTEFRPKAWRARVHACLELAWTLNAFPTGFRKDEAFGLGRYKCIDVNVPAHALDGNLRAFDPNKIPGVGFAATAR